MRATLLDPRHALLLVLALVAVSYLAVLLRALRRRHHTGDHLGPTGPQLLTGFGTNFFDTLGVGSFAPTTAVFRRFRLVPDEHIPGTLNVGHTLPAIVQAFIFTTIVPVDARTLVALIAAAVVGAWFGAGIVARLPRHRIQLGMGLALFGASALLLVQLANRNPSPGTLLGLGNTALLIGVAGNLVLGALMTLGIGLYAPCMIMIYLLGMDPKAAFPIMMGSCAFLMPVASMRFIRERSFDARASLGLLVGGIPAVLIAAFLVKEMPLTVVRWLVLVVVVYTAAGLVRAARRRRPGDDGVAPVAATAGSTAP